MALGAYVPLLWYPSASTVTPPPYCLSVDVRAMFHVQAVCVPLLPVSAPPPAPIFRVVLSGRGPMFDVAVDPGEC